MTKREIKNCLIVGLLMAVALGIGSTITQVIGPRSIFVYLFIPLLVFVSPAWLLLEIAKKGSYSIPYDADRATQLMLRLKNLAWFSLAVFLFYFTTAFIFTFLKKKLGGTKYSWIIYLLGAFLLISMTFLGLGIASAFD